MGRGTQALSVLEKGSTVDILLPLGNSWLSSLENLEAENSRRAPQQAIIVAGGIGSVAGTLLGALFLGIISSALPVINVSPFWQMAQHVVNHASYHRGQVVTMLRQLGVPPPKSLDMIAFYRTRGG